ATSPFGMPWHGGWMGSTFGRQTLAQTFPHLRRRNSGTHYARFPFSLPFSFSVAFLSLFFMFDLIDACHSVRRTPTRTRGSSRGLPIPAKFRVGRFTVTQSWALVVFYI